MDVAGSDPVADHRAIAAGIDRDMDAEMLADVQGVRQRVLQGCIAGYAGDADQIDRRVLASSCPVSQSRMILVGFIGSPPLPIWLLSYGISIIGVRTSEIGEISCF